MLRNGCFSGRPCYDWFEAIGSCSWAAQLIVSKNRMSGIMVSGCSETKDVNEAPSSLYPSSVDINNQPESEVGFCLLAQVYFMLYGE